METTPQMNEEEEKFQIPEERKTFFKTHQEIHVQGHVDMFQ